MSTLSMIIILCKNENLFWVMIKTRQLIYVQRNIEARSCNHCCRGKAIIITYSKCVFVALTIQHAMRMRHFCGVSGCTIFFHITSQTARISKWGIEHKMLFGFYLQIMSEIFLILRRTERDMFKIVCWSSRRVVVFFQILMELEFSRKIFEK